RVTVKGERRLWAICAVVGVVTFAVRSEVAVLFILSGLVGVAIYAPRGWLRRAQATPIAVPVGLGTVWAATQSTDPNVLLQLGVFFFKAGAFTFGSGLAIVAFLQHGVVRDFGWLCVGVVLGVMAMWE